MGLEPVGLFKYYPYALILAIFLTHATFRVRSVYAQTTAALPLVRIRQHVKSFERSLPENHLCKQTTKLSSKWHFQEEIVIEYLNPVFRNFREFTERKKNPVSKGEGS